MLGRLVEVIGGKLHVFYLDTASIEGFSTQVIGMASVKEGE